MADVRGWIEFDGVDEYVFVPKQLPDGHTFATEPQAHHDAVWVSIPEQDYVNYLQLEQQMMEWDRKLVQLYRTERPYDS